jgi:ferredoxin
MEWRITLNEVAAKPRVLLKVLEDKAAPIISECRGGTCGACRCKKISGDIEYLRDPIGMHGKDEILPCIAIPKTDVVLEVES